MVLNDVESFEIVEAVKIDIDEEQDKKTDLDDSTKRV